MNDNRRLVDLAVEVWRAQDACNLSGLVHAWSRSITRMRELFPYEGTDFFNRHPINKMWAHKIVDLTRAGLGDTADFQVASEFCEALVESKKA